MLTLPIKKQWFLMIRSGEKTEEYRNPTPYWHTRFETLFGEPLHQAASLKHKAWVRFRNGYGISSPEFDALVSFPTAPGTRTGALKEVGFITFCESTK